MAYTYDFSFDLGDSQTGLTVHLGRYDHLGVLAETIATGIVEIGHGKYIYRHTSLPDGSAGTMLAYDSADASVNALEDYSPVEANVAAILAAIGTTGVTINAATLLAIADAVLKRGVGNVEDDADPHSLGAVILGMFESSAPGTTWTTYKTDGVTVFAIRTLTEDAAALPVVGVT